MPTPESAERRREAPDRNLAMELVRVTEAAAMAAGRWVGRGDKNEPNVVGAFVHIQQRVCRIFSVVLRCELCPGERRLNRDAGGPNACGQKRSGNGRTFASPFAPI
jgi:hypothetical protein